MKNIKFIFILSFFWLSQYISAQQITKVRGTVKDKETGEAIPFANVFFKGTTIGTITNDAGEFFIETRTPSDSLCVTILGYSPITQKITFGAFQNFSFELEPSNIFINEVVVKPDDSYAKSMVRKMIAHKDKNNPENIPAYQFECYNKMQFDINNIDEKLENRKILKQLKFVFDNVDTSAVTGGKTLPFLLVESVSDNYYQKKPKVKREVIKASKISGIENKSVSQYTGKIYIESNIYDNFIYILDQGFVSPASDFGLQYYKYYVIDSAFIGNHWCYNLSFVPRRKQEPTFTGNMWIADSSFAVVRSQIRIAKGVNLNFVKDLIENDEYENINDSLWLPASQKFLISFNLTKKSTGFVGTRTSIYKNYTFPESISDNIKNIKSTATVSDDALKKDDSYWDSARYVPLTKKEQNIYVMVDSVQKLPIYKTVSDIAYLLVNSYYETKDVEFGPYYTVYSYNPIEGNRFRIGGRTSNDFSTKLMLEGHIAYGTLDQRFKYGASTIYMFKKEPRISSGINFENDIQQLGKSDNSLLTDNILSSVLRRNPNNKLNFVYSRKFYFEKEWFNGFSNTLTVNYQRVVHGENVPFEKNINGVMTNVPYITSASVSLNTRFAYDERYLSGEFDRVSLGSTYPIIDLNLTKGIKNFIGGQYNFLKVDLSVSHKLYLDPFGYLKYQVDAGKIFGRLPYPFLEIHKGNETYAFDYFAFNMMNYYEFVSDQWFDVFTEQHFQGFFLNHVPLFRKLKWREVASFRGLIGSVSDKQRSVMAFPEGLYSVNKPYFEASVGVENIFKIFRVDAMWRLNHLDNPDVSAFGIRAMLQLIF